MAAPGEPGGPGHVYALELEGGNWYVGHTERTPPERRVLEHFESPGRPAAWTRRHRPRSLAGLWPGGPGDETAKTLELMAEHGVERVRGGPWCQLELAGGTLRELERAIAHERGRCNVCGGDGHWAAGCPEAGRRRAPARACGRCGRRGHRQEDCRAYNDRDGRQLPCLRCGRASHVHRDCYARTTVDGERLG